MFEFKYSTKEYYCDNGEKVPVTLVYTINESDVSLYSVLEHFEQFLKGAGFASILESTHLTLETEKK